MVLDQMSDPCVMSLFRWVWGISTIASIHALILNAAFDVKARVGSTEFLELFGRKLLVDLLDVDEFLDGEDLTGDLL